MAAVITYLERLRELDLDQHGFVTTAQALADGVPHAELSKLVARGRLERVAHGVYRVPQVRGTRFDEMHLAVLWTGAPEACLSHETALDAYELSDVNPNRYHVTVDSKRRLRRAGGDQVVVHHQDLAPSQVGWWEEIPTVTPATAIAQCIDYGTPSYLLSQAIDNAHRRGRITAAQRDDLSRKLGERHG